MFQLVRECKEVLKGGLLMKQYYQFMLRGIISDSQGLQTTANIDEFEEDLHEMLEACLLIFLCSPGNQRLFSFVIISSLLFFYTILFKKILMYSSVPRFDHGVKVYICPRMAQADSITGNNMCHPPSRNSCVFNNIQFIIFFADIQLKRKLQLSR